MKDEKFIIDQSFNWDNITQVKQTILSKNGINAIRFDREANTITLDYDDNKYNKQQLLRMVKDSGLDAYTH